MTFLLLKPQGLSHQSGGPSFFARRDRTVMAFAIRNLSVLAYANGFTLWHYKAGRDGLDLVETRDFFSDAADMLAEGDMMMVSASDGGRVLCVAPCVAGEVETARLA
jgi:hypothetical protein